ncbi:unnamed protein product [Soboliphyme baturini]|uniref:RRM domain-containing protein n=1 Tax=Soboliphyme baturini TaxID=241478 RepID=A0A183ILX4_9BILA|nr:unnamed protein product [Soboliphyme baturini]
MVWNNPYPKKTAQPDKGTTLWGDPNAQGEIHRWKSCSDDLMPSVIQTELPLSPPPTLMSGVSSNSSIALTSTSGQAAASSSSAANSNSVWKDSPIAPQPLKMSSGGVGSWNSSAEKQSPVQGPTSTSASTTTTAISGNGLTSNSVAATSCQSVTSPDCKNWLDTTGKHTSSVYSSTSQWNEAVTGGDSSKQQLTQQIADQLCAAVRAGLVDMSILHHPLPQETLLKLNHLLQFIPKLEKTRAEIQKLQQKMPLNVAQQNELQRYLLEMHQLKSSIQNLKMQISAQTNFPGVNLRSPGGTSMGPDSCYLTDTFNQSKLLQWKQSLGATGSSNEVVTDRNKLNASASVPNLENLENVLVNLNLGAVKDPWSMKRGSVLEWPQELQTKGCRNGGSNTNGGNFTVDPLNADSDISGGGFASGFDEGPPEFRPGQKWEWKDPKEVADDPNATPEFSTLTSTGFMNNCVPSFPFNASFMGMPNAGGGGRSSYESKQHPMCQNIGGCGDSWGTRGSRPHPQMHQSLTRYPFSSASSSVASSFVPFNNRSCANQWIVLLNLNQVDEQTLQLIFSRIGSINAFFYPPGAGFAAVRFKDVIAEKVFSRVQQEFAPIGVTVQLAKDGEVERLIQSFANQRQPQQQQPSSGYGHAAAAHVSHNMMWELPPPHSGQWPGNSGPPPPPFTGPPGIPLADPIALMHHGVGPIFNDGLYSTDRQPTFS